MSSEGHRIFLSLGDADVRSAGLNAREILARTIRGFEVFLIGSRAAVDALYANHPDLRTSFKSVALHGQSGHSDALAHILGVFQDRDFLFVKSGTVLPEHWDLRLAWTAERFPGIATVSPVFDDDFLTPGRAEIGGREVLNAESLDRLCYRHSQFGFIEASDYRSDCVYVRSEAVRAALPHEIAPAERLRRFSAGVKKLRYSHLVADHVFARAAGPSSAEFEGDTPPRSTPCASKFTPR